ncbi:TetR/AcrR family transcriptional regulator [Streptomyces albidoflavus]|uniref:TetR/AcrR family transcriptional regulator n=1 Tax=Streptomyces albidoflavus TaxID=1886 RepID=UPI00188A6891|nr:TetR/AcrR family transcriptional regulator [Streptomyces albidoflavus]MBF4136863.1 TetR family transcriptional regulator [Streptomyces albidoflavus]
MDSTEETPAATPDAPLGLRERKKAATRQAVHEAAMRLTRAHGLDHVTVEAIADAAGISRRTFSNYFAGKEDALLYGKEQYIQRLLDAVRDRPAEESNWQALRAATQVLRDPRLDPPRREWAQQTRLAMSHPSLLGRQLSTLATFESDLATTLTARSPTDPVRARVMAAAFLVALRIAMQLWIEENEQAEDPMELMMITMDEMGARFV